MALAGGFANCQRQFQRCIDLKPERRNVQCSAQPLIGPLRPETSPGKRGPPTCSALWFWAKRKIGHCVQCATCSPSPSPHPSTARQGNSASPPTFPGIDALCQAVSVCSALSWYETSTIQFCMEQACQKTKNVMEAGACLMDPQL